MEHTSRSSEQITSLQSQLRVVQHEAEVSKIGAVATLKNELQLAQLEAQKELKAALQEAEQQCVEAAESKCSAEIAGWKSKLDGAAYREQQLIEQMEAAKAEATQAHNQVRSEAAKCKTLEDALQSLQSMMSRREDALHSSDKKLQDQKKTTIQTQARIDVQRREARKTLEEAEKAAGAREESIKTELSQLQAQLGVEQHSAAATHSEARAEQHHSKVAGESSDSIRVAELEMQLTKLTVIIEETDSQIETQQGQLDRKDQELVAQCGTNKRLHQQLEELRDQMLNSKANSGRQRAEGVCAGCQQAKKKLKAEIEGVKESIEQLSVHHQEVCRLAAGRVCWLMSSCRRVLRMHCSKRGTS